MPVPRKSYYLVNRTATKMGTSHLAATKTNAAQGAPMRPGTRQGPQIWDPGALNVTQTENQDCGAPEDDRKSENLATEDWQLVGSGKKQKALGLEIWSRLGGEGLTGHMERCRWCFWRS